MTATANNRIHEWYKDATALYGLWISDNGGAAAQWIKVTGGQAAGNSAIDIGPSVGVNFSVTTGGVNITGSATSNGSLTLTDTGAAGANFKMTGNGATTPSKFLRVSGGAFEVISSAYTASLFGVHEDGTLTDIRALQIVRDPGATSANIPIGGIIGGQGAGMSTVKALDSVTLSGSVTITQTGFGGSLPALTTGTYRLITFTGGTNAVFMRIG
jgi:hypothetical protein